MYKGSYHEKKSVLAMKVTQTSTRQRGTFSCEPNLLHFCHTDVSNEDLFRV